MCQCVWDSAAQVIIAFDVEQTLCCLFVRFSPEEKEGRNALAHLPFGLGPRNCIGMRFALMEAKMALTKILKDYIFVCTAKTQV